MGMVAKVVVVTTTLRCLALFFFSGSSFILLENETVFDDADPAFLCGCSASGPLPGELVAAEPAEAETAVPDYLEGSSVDSTTLLEESSVDGVSKFIFRGR